MDSAPLDDQLPVPMRDGDLMDSLVSLSQADLLNVISQLLPHVSQEAVANVRTYIATLQPVEASSSGKHLQGAAAGSASSDTVAAMLPAPMHAATLSETKMKKKKEQRPFEMSKYKQHHIMLRIQYEGGPYYGFASQAGECEDTIEKYLFDALLKLKLIESRQTCDYARCGRTDKGVSALGQVVSLTVRSAQRADDVSSKSVPELDYCTLLNKCFPENIRVLVWQRVTPEFNARFSAAYRTYRYFFTKRHRDIASMQAAAALLVGAHDFRNFCKIDIANVSNFVRNVHSAEIKPFMVAPRSRSSSCGDSDNDNYDGSGSDSDVWMLEIKGVAFLWHMIRCIMAVLFAVGEHGEPPTVVSALLDVTQHPRKPFYEMAGELPLVLTECGYDHVQCVYEPHVLWALTAHFENVFDRHTVAAARAKNALAVLGEVPVRASAADLHCDKQMKATVRHDANSRRNNHSHNGSNNTGSEMITSNGSAKRPRLATSSSSFSEDKPSQACSNEDGASLGGQGAGEGDPGAPHHDQQPPLLVPWHTVLTRLAAVGVYPAEEHIPPYVPLLQRTCGPMYEERCETVGGTRKDRLHRHLSLKGKASEADPQFFARLRSQGTIDG